MIFSVSAMSNIKRKMSEINVNSAVNVISMVHLLKARSRSHEWMFFTASLPPFDKQWHCRRCEKLFSFIRFRHTVALCNIFFGCIFVLFWYDILTFFSGLVWNRWITAHGQGSMYLLDQSHLDMKVCYFNNV